jgi:prevent-host-death family protein
MLIVVVFVNSNARTEFQVIVGKDGKPAFVVVPYDQFRRMKGGLARGTVPNDVVHLTFGRGVSPMAAWREHLGLTQAEVAGRVGITQAAYAQMERAMRPRNATLEKVAAAMGLEVEQLRW